MKFDQLTNISLSSKLFSTYGNFEKSCDFFPIFFPDFNIFFYTSSWTGKQVPIFLYFIKNSGLCTDPVHHKCEKVQSTTLTSSNCSCERHDGELYWVIPCSDNQSHAQWLAYCKAGVHLIDHGNFCSLWFYPL